MTGTEQDRIATLERETQALSERLARLERRTVVTDSRPPVFYAAPRAPKPDPPPSVRPEAVRPEALVAAAAPRPRLEDVLGGRVLAWTGGIAVVLGIVFLLAIAVSHGWIGEGARTAMAGLGSLALLAAGVWLRERRGQTDAALAAAAAGIAAMFVTVVVGGPVYGVLPVAAAFALALATGAAATMLAVRWKATGIGALGICGAVVSPVLAGGVFEPTSLVLLWIAAASGVGVLVWQRWDWLALAIFGLALPQWLGWLLVEDQSVAGSLLVLTAFGAVNAGAAIGFELRVPSTRLRMSSAFLLAANALVLALGGWYALEGETGVAIAQVWLGALAAAHLAVGLAAAATRVNRDIRLLVLALGVVLADVTLGVVLDGVALAGAWGLATATFGFLASELLRDGGSGQPGRDEALLGIGLGGHLLLTVCQALMQAPPDAVWTGATVGAAGHAAVAVAAVAAFVAGRFTDEISRKWRTGLDGVALAASLYLTAVALDGPMLAVALAAEAVVLSKLAHPRSDTVAAGGSAAFLGAALAHALAFEAPPSALVAGLEDVGAGALALGVIAAAALQAARLPWEETHVRTALTGTGAAVLLYLASTALVTMCVPLDGTQAGDLLELGPRQLGQASLSALWAAVGVTALVVGLRRDLRALRIGALGLLCVTVAKVFVFDLATLTSMYRVVSFIALGLLLLFAAFVWQKLRPRPLPDLRTQ